MNHSRADSRRIPWIDDVHESDNRASASKERSSVGAERLVCYYREPKITEIVQEESFSSAVLQSDEKQIISQAIYEDRQNRLRQYVQAREWDLLKKEFFSLAQDTRPLESNKLALIYELIDSVSSIGAFDVVVELLDILSSNDVFISNEIIASRTHYLHLVNELDDISRTFKYPRVTREMRVIESVIGLSESGPRDVISEFGGNQLSVDEIISAVNETIDLVNANERLSLSELESRSPLGHHLTRFIVKCLSEKKAISLD